MYNNDMVGVFFARGTSIMEARMMPAAEIPEPNAIIELKERSLHVRTNEHCTRPCCATEPVKSFQVVSKRLFQSREQSGSSSALDQVIGDRQWDELNCDKHHEWCSLFDSYSLISYLGLRSLAEPTLAAIVEVE